MHLLVYSLTQSFMHPSIHTSTHLLLICSAEVVHLCKNLQLISATHVFCTGLCEAVSHPFIHWSYLLLHLCVQSCMYVSATVRSCEEGSTPSPSSHLLLLVLVFSFCSFCFCCCLPPVCTRCRCLTACVFLPHGSQDNNLLQHKCGGVGESRGLTPFLMFLLLLTAAVAFACRCISCATMRGGGGVGLRGPNPH